MTPGAVLIALVIAFGAATALSSDARAQRRDTARPEHVPADAVRMLEVRPHVYMLTAGDTNVAVQIGTQGVLLVDTPPPSLANEAFAALAQVTPAPIRYVVNTSAAREHIAGNEAIAARSAASGGAPRQGGNPVLLGTAAGMSILAHEAVLNRLTSAIGGDVVPRGMLPTSEYFEPTKDFSFNGEPVIVYHMPNAISDGDSIVFLRSSDVIAAGDIFTPDRYPRIDRARGGSVQGLLAALNTILALTVPEAFSEGGTKVIPGHGRLSEEIDVAEYRDMVYLVTERVRASIAKGETLAQIQAERPTLDYDLEYPSAAVTPAMFVEAVYSSLIDEKER